MFVGQFDDALEHGFFSQAGVVSGKTATYFRNYLLRSNGMLHHIM
jgi:hypothetical protein